MRIESFNEGQQLDKVHMRFISITSFSLIYGKPQPFFNRFREK